MSQGGLTKKSKKSSKSKKSKKRKGSRLSSGASSNGDKSEKPDREAELVSPNKRGSMASFRTNKSDLLKPLSNRNIQEEDANFDIQTP